MDTSILIPFCAVFGRVPTLCIAPESLKPKGPKLKSEKLSTTLEVKSPTPSLPPKLTYGGREILHKKAILVKIKNLGSGAGVFVLQFLGHNGTPKYRLLRWQGSCLWLWQLQRLVHF